MNILVLASASRTSGALTIYKQFITHLEHYLGGHKYYIFVDPSMPQPQLQNVEYIHEPNHSFRRRMYMDKEGYMKVMSDRNITPDVVFSLQNTGVVAGCKQVIYYHQSLPFYKQKWNPLKTSERQMFLYKHIYPYFVKRTLNDNTEIVTQIPFVKKGFVKRFHYNPDKVHVMFPDVEKINVDTVSNKQLQEGLYHFLYPATAAPYKEHATIVHAIAALNRTESELAKRIRVHFTIAQAVYPALSGFINEKHIRECFEFHGSMPYQELLSLYKVSCGLLFPSTIETLGLPLLEAAAFGLPILAADLDYAHEVTEGYEGVRFIEPKNADEWAKNIKTLCLQPPKYQPLEVKDSEWPKIFDLILK